MRTLPLQGVRVLSIEQFGSAPYATMFLADMGAEVIKLEAGAGDFARQTGPKTLGEGDSLYFQCFNMNKKSVLLDIKDSDDYARFLELAATSDAVINNLRGHLPAARGLTYAALKGANPAIVCGHISAYGRDNTRQRRPGYDFLMQAEAGLMAVTGEPGAPPTRIGVSIIDYMTGMTMALGVMSAVHSASIDGVGRDVDVSLFDVAIHQLAYQGVWRLNGQDVTERAPRSAHSHTTPVQLFRTNDGWVYVACMSDKFWHALREKLGQPESLGGEDFASMEGRLTRRDVLTQRLDAIFSQRPTAVWLELLEGAVPLAPVRSLDDALDNPFLLEESGMVTSLAHASGALRMLANPIKLDGVRLPQKPGPALGADTDAVLASARAERDAARQSS